MATSVEKEKPIMCESCGAPLKIGFGATLITCEYCGSSMTVSGEVAKLISKHSMLLNKITPGQAVEEAKKWMDSGIFRVGVSKEATVTEVSLKYLPVWTVPVTVTGNYSASSSGGFAADTRQMSDSWKEKDKKGFLKGLGKLAIKGAAIGAMAYGGGRMMSTRGRSGGGALVGGTMTHGMTTGGQRGPASGPISKQYYELMLARRASDIDLNQYQIPVQEKEIFTIGKIPADAEILNGDMLEEEAKARADALGREQVRKELSHQYDTIHALNINTALGEGELIHIPVWFVSYEHKGVNRAAGVDGITCKVVNGTRPTVSLGVLGKKKES
ncbi:MAG: hypothetical protein KJ655_06715 [Candidatus Thermoplasmatota archaeon]|nr:hypothetical protein [Candidatus Thermoplasmatota archaeon]